jgi:hypothetical protein
MLSHEPKNYALLRHDGELVLRGVAFRSSRAEPFGETFLRRALVSLLANDLVGVQDAYLATISALRRRALPTRDVAARVRLTKPPDQYLATRDSRRELPYEAVLASGRSQWAVGEHVRVYRATRGRSGLLIEPGEPDATDASRGNAGLAPEASPVAAAAAAAADPTDPRDYDIDHYLRVLRDTYAARLARALVPDDYAAIFADPDQPSLFARSLRDARPILTLVARSAPPEAAAEQ